VQGTELGGSRKGQSNEAGQDEEDDIDMKIFQNSSDRYANQSLLKHIYVIHHVCRSTSVVRYSMMKLDLRSVA
jgi:hypothetical protein